MKISKLLAHPIAVADGPLRSSYGLHAPYALRTIIELKTTDGITGFSETYGGDRQLATYERLRPRIEGMDPFQLTSLWQDLMSDAKGDGDPSHTMLVPGENPLDEPQRAFAAIEIACLDIIGKSLGKPLCDVVGGRARSEASFSAYLFYKHAGGGGLGDDVREDEYGECLTPESIVRQCHQMIANYGFKEIKLKGGVLDPDQEIAAIRALRAEFGPSYPLRIDPNSAWSVDTSVRVGVELKEELKYGGYLEDPCAGIDGMAEVRRRLLEQGIDTPFASNVAVTSFAAVPEAWKQDGCQVVLSDPHYWGGIRKQQQLSDLCEVLGMGLSMHSNNHLGVSMMIMAHAACASRHLTHACDTHYPWQRSTDEVVLGGRVPISGGVVRITDKPGLGVDLDYDQVARGTERYHKLTYRKRDDEAEMRSRIDPNWRRVLPRW